MFVPTFRRRAPPSPRRPKDDTVSIPNEAIEPNPSGTAQKRTWTAPRVSRVKLSETANSNATVADGPSFS